MNFYEAENVLVNLVAGVTPIKCLVEWMRHYHINDTMLLFTRNDRNNNDSSTFIIHYYPSQDASNGPIDFQDIKAAIKEAAEHSFAVTAANGRIMLFMWTYTEDFTERTLWWYNRNNDVWKYADDVLVKLFEDNHDIAMDYIEENC